MKTRRDRRAPGRSDRLGWFRRIGWNPENRGPGPSARVRIAIGRATERVVQPFDGPGSSTEGTTPGEPTA